MKKDVLALISDSEKGKSNINYPPVVIIVLLFFLLLLTPILYGKEKLNSYTIDEIYLKFNDRIEVAAISRYQPLLFFHQGEHFNYMKIRQSIENLYKVGSFDNIETRAIKKNGKQLDIYLIISEKYKVHSIKIRQAYKSDNLIHIMPLSLFKKKELENVIYSLRKGDYFEEEKLDIMVMEVKNFLKSKGYYQAGVTYEVIKDHRRLTAIVKILIMPGMQTSINKVNLAVSPSELRSPLEKFLEPYMDGNSSKAVNHHDYINYIPTQFQKTVEKIKRFLAQKKYYFPDITVKENFLDSEKHRLDLEIVVEAGFKYVLKFKGIKNKMSLISSIWEKKVFEKWAVKESKARILYHLKNKGYFNAKVETDIEMEENAKIITFNVKTGRKYTLGKIYIEGNQSISKEELLKLIEVDDLVFDRYFYLRLNKLLLDQEILRLYYFSKGFPSARVSTETSFRDKRVDIYFKIREGEKFTVDTILFEGNRFFNSQALSSFMQTRVNKPFVQQTLYRDIEKITRIYHQYGFDNIEINTEVSPGKKKSILVQIKEGKSFRMGTLVIIGASSSQRKLLEKMFPLEKDQPYDQLKVEAFKNDIESSTIFNQFRILKIEREPDFLDILIKVNPDRSIFYGFGIGWEERKGMRGTLEYQERNVLNTISTFSAMVQVGKYEKRGLLSYDTPYFLRTHINASLKLWYDNEIYPSYQFDRFGFAETLLRRIKSNSYLMGSLSWYRTTLTDLDISPQGVDQLHVPFDTTALNLSFVREKRDDPFNPTTGSFFSSDLKIGLPLFEKDYAFIKFRWSYQRNFKILKNGVFSASVRNGLATGDMSITERFFAGGIKTFRGTNRDQLSPLDPITQNPRGGNAMLLFNFETTFPLQFLPVNDLYYAVFADIGNVFDSVKDLSFGRLESAVGISFKYKTNLGPFRFDVAWNIDTGKPKFHIGIGNVF